MDWLELKILISGKDTERAENIVNMAVPYGFYLEDYSDIETAAKEIAHIDLIDEELLAKDRTRSVIHIYLDPENSPESIIGYISERFGIEGIEYEFDKSSVNDADWADNWKKFFKVTPIGNRLVIRPTWEEYDNTEGKTVLSIDPGAAFGTGTHATTRMCLELIERNVTNGIDFLDVGSGSGILSIAAALLGAKKAVGVDIDPVAVKVANENAEINGIEGKTEFLVGDLAEKVEGKYEIVCANIVADIIMRLSANVKNYMYDDSLFVCSGIIDIRKDEVEQNLIDNGFEIVETLTVENWYAFAARIKSR